VEGQVQMAITTLNPAASGSGAGSSLNNQATQARNAIGQFSLQQSIEDAWYAAEQQAALAKLQTAKQGAGSIS
jgi:hypothetical protein